MVMEVLRRNQGYCNGLIFWMHNDCWPAAAGWSLVDYYCLPKPAYYSFRRCARELIVSVSNAKPLVSNVQLFVSNCTDHEKSFTVTLYRFRISMLSKAFEAVTLKGCAQAYGVSELTLPFECQKDELIVCDLSYDGKKDRCFYRHGTLLLRTTDAVRVISRSSDEIILSADSYVHVVEFEGQFTFEDNYFSLLPSEVKRVSLQNFENPEKLDFTITAYTFAS